MQAASTRSAPYMDKIPYPFWPPLPWSVDPTLPHLDLDLVDQPGHAHACAWLSTKPYQPGGADETLWHGVKVLGTGSYGAAGVWAQTNDTKQIIDRMVIKETPSFTPARWRDPKEWRDQVPREIRIHQLIEERRADNRNMCHHLVHMRAHRLFMAQRRYRLYLDLYTGGALEEAMGSYNENGENGENGKNDFPVPNKILPEAYIWYVIKALAEACTVLRKGTTDEAAIEGWKPITHLDLQLVNVLLKVESGADLETDSGKGKGTAAVDAEKNTNLPAIIPVLTDFGMSFLSPENNGCPLSDNPEDYVLNEVCPRYPPEYQHQFLRESVPLGEATDVWGIGRIAWDLVANRCTATGPVRDERDSRGDYIPLSSFEDPRNMVINDRTTTLTGGKLFPAAAKYSDELRDLVRECLNFDMEHRPSLDKLYRAATKYLEDTDGAMDVLRDRDELGLLELDLEEFEIGKVFKVPESKKRKRDEDDEDSRDKDSRDKDRGDEDRGDEDSKDEDGEDENSGDEEDSESD